MATTGPVFEPVLKLNMIVSDPSVTDSAITDLVTVPELFVIVTVPLLTESLKSAAVVVPEFVQYNIVLSAVLVVATV
jgi:hypothetical protein